MPGLTDLQISLYSEEDVTVVIDGLPSLKYLNNLSVKEVTESNTELTSVKETNEEDPPLLSVVEHSVKSSDENEEE
jgi:hypothetical protein